MVLLHFVERFTRIPVRFEKLMGVSVNPMRVRQRLNEKFNEIAVEVSNFCTEHKRTVLDFTVELLHSLDEPLSIEKVHVCSIEGYTAVVACEEFRFRQSEVRTEPNCHKVSRVVAADLHA